MNFVCGSWFFLLFYGVASLGDFKTKERSFDIHHKMTNNELQKYFGVSSLFDVPDYDISYPSNSNELGEQVTEYRSKRDIDNSAETKYYQMTAFGKGMHLNVTLNKHLLGPNFYVETRHKDGTKTITDAPHRNFYHGHVVSNPGSLVALSDNRGVSGAILLTDDEMLYVHPLPSHLSDEQDLKKERIPHLVVKRSAKDLQLEKIQMFEREELPKKVQEFKESDLEVEFDTDQHRFLEVVYVGDHLITEQVGLRELPDMLLIIGNIVARMYTDSTFGEIKLTYVVTKLVILNNGELNYFRNASNGNKLDVFGRWLLENNPEGDKNPDHVDTGTLFTSYTGGGLALSGGMCTYRDMKAVVGSIGLSSSAIAAHENFHNLGYGHDINSGCPNGASIMSTYVPSGKAAFTWSNCTRKYIQSYLRSRWSHCLNDAPTAKRPSLPPLIRGKLPGTVFDGDKQCEYKHSLGSKRCSVTCSTLFCTTNGGSCYSTGGAPADGTQCGQEKWCIRGECVSDGSPVVNGNWSSWTEYTPCTRTCGIGVQHRTRKCDNPSPKNSGEPCSGKSKGEYRTCNTHACPVHSKSFRELQCKSKGVNNTAFISEGAECYLWCWAGDGYGYLHGQVKDGTPCYSSPVNKDICISGECKVLGCDNQLNSAVENDRCKICGGDGSSCELREMNYTKYHNIYGFENADTMVVLKKGSTNVHAKMQGKTWNTIGIQDKNGKYLINLPSWTTSVYKAGTEITYIHKSHQYNDEIIVPGPLTEELKLVFIHIRSRNQGVNIRYYSPVGIATKPPQDIFYWNAGDWSTCSKTCAGGKSLRKIKCLRHDDQSRVGDAMCLGKPKQDSEKSCNNQPCPAEWHLYVTSCSKICGRGVETSKTICRRMTTKSWVVVKDSECVNLPPKSKDSQRYCNEIACPPDYNTEPWSTCSTTCGKGTLTRKLKCQIINNDGSKTTLPISTCEHHGVSKPSTMKKCNYDKPCKPALKYAGIGCFSDGAGSNRALPTMIANLRPLIDWKKPNATIERCALLAKERDLEYFAIQYYGECWSTPKGSIVQYDKHGPSTNCWAGLGGAWTNYVYKFTTEIVKLKH